MWLQKFYQSFDLGTVKSLIWQTSRTAYSCSQLSTREIKACSNTVLHVSLDRSKHLTLLLNCDQMRNYRLQLNFSNHLYKNASQSNFETSEVLIRTWSQVLPGTRAGHWYSCLSALPCLHQISKTCRKYFRHFKMSKKVNTSMCMPLTKSIQVCNKI